jgi:hypothetical protein
MFFMNMFIAAHAMEERPKSEISLRDKAKARELSKKVLPVTISKSIVETFVTQCMQIYGQQLDITQVAPFSFEDVNFELKKVQVREDQRPSFFIIATIRERYPTIYDFATNTLKDKILKAIKDGELSVTDSYVFKLDGKSRYVISYDDKLNPDNGRFELQKEIRCFVFMK